VTKLVQLFAHLFAPRDFEDPFQIDLQRFLALAS
jgi:hypothetical protein